MDQATQQNAALVEEMAAAASSLKSQAQDLVQVVAVFQLSPDALSAAPRKPVSAPVRAPARAALASPGPERRNIATAPVRKASAAPSAVAKADDDWETF